MKRSPCIKSYCILLIFLVLGREGKCQNAEISINNIESIDYPDFPKANSTWNDIGYNPVNNSVYVGVTNHTDKIGFYQYDVAEHKMELKGFIDEMTHLRDFQWQGKVHTKIIADQDGIVYFGTDGGESREEYLMNHSHGYAGGYIMKWDEENQRMTNLGMPMQYESIKDVDIDIKNGNIYAITYPQVHFIVFNPKTNDLKDFGRLGSAHVPRVIFTDQWGSCYYVDWRQRLVKFDNESEKLIFAKESLPAFPGTPGSKIITGITTYAKDNKNNIIYLVTYGAKVLAFHPQKKGIGKIEDLGALYDLKDQPLWKPYVPNLNLGDNGKLYYFIGGHGNYVKKDTTLLMEFDPISRNKEIVLEFSTDEISEVTGSDTKDKNGVLYYAGRKLAPKKNNLDVNHSINDKVSIPFMIRFHPEKKLR